MEMTRLWPKNSALVPFDAVSLWNWAQVEMYRKWAPCGHLLSLPSASVWPRKPQRTPAPANPNNKETAPNTLAWSYCVDKRCTISSRFCNWWTRHAQFGHKYNMYMKWSPRGSSRITSATEGGRSNADTCSQSGYDKVGKPANQVRSQTTRTTRPFVWSLSVSCIIVKLHGPCLS